MASLLETLMKRMGCGDRDDIAEEAKELLRQAEANQNVGENLNTLAIKSIRG